MDPTKQHTLPPDVAFDGGDLDCGNGLLLLIRKHIDPLPRGGLLEIRSTEISVDEDLPGLDVQQPVGGDPGVGTADPQHVRRLLLRQPDAAVGSYGVGRFDGNDPLMRSAPVTDPSALRGIGCVIL